MTKFLPLMMILSFLGLNLHTKAACSFTINATKTQPTCGCNGLINFSLTNPPSTGAKFDVFKENLLNVTSNGNGLNLNGLCPGTYKVIVTDPSNGCQDSMLNIVLDAPTTALSATYVADSVRCDSSKNGKITLAISNASFPVTYKWSHNTLEKDSIAENLIVGTYAVTITDNANCRVELSNMKIKEQFGKMNLVDSLIIPTSCDSPIGLINLVVTGTHNPTYKWLHSDSFSMPLDSLIAGFYTCIFEDTLKCYPLIITKEIKKNPAPVVTAFGSDSICFNIGYGSVFSKITSGDSTQMTYLWSNGATANKISGVPAGKYSVIARDKAGCKDTATWTINNYPPRGIYLTADKTDITKGTSIFIKIDSTSGFSKIKWTVDTPASYTPTANFSIWVSPDTTTVYKVSAIYGPGCIAKNSIIIKVKPNYTNENTDYVFPTIFSPSDPNPVNRVFTKTPYSKNRINDTLDQNISSFEIHIYDRWGNVVYEDFNKEFKWDGTDKKGEPMNSGAYVYVAKYALVSDPFNKIVKSGSILLER